MSYNLPLQITIPTPDEIPKGFGPNSTGKRGGNLRVRCTDAEYDLIQKEAADLGISLAMFTRWCAVHVAMKIKQYRDDAASKTVGEENNANSTEAGRRV
jgi:hypothetical protein